MAGWPARANWIASAVPQEPAPSTAMRLVGLMSPAAAGRRSGCSKGVARCAFLHGLLVQRVEVDRLQQQLREAAAGDQIGDRFACERVQRGRTEAAEQHGLLFRRIALDEE